MSFDSQFLEHWVEKKASKALPDKFFETKKIMCSFDESEIICLAIVKKKIC